ncbi:MAG: 2-oxoacid:acceptor oxidoreductase subunit alpha [Deltaproteobacteria bacterium]|nr:2-oxoacid:acceptor oxidoreductase subunit alpha [Deltaproteobacteria bacterium]
MKKEVLVRVGGEGGEGVISTGEILTQALARSSYDVFTYRTYPAEIKGGYAMFQVRISTQGPVPSAGENPDLLVLFNREAYENNASLIEKDTLLIYDSQEFEPQEACFPYAIPLGKIAREQIGNPLTKNIVCLGAISQILGAPMDRVREILRSKFASKGDLLIEKNLLALETGWKYVQENFPARPEFRLESPSRKKDDIVVSGNQAICLGAVVAGCRAMFGYPITPASDILEWMSRELPRFQGIVVQTEDEIAALSATIGASYAGKKSMTATSGPGFSLMTELMGLASMAEIPVVVVDSQRSGPSTGMPTKTEQSDLNLAVYGAHGEGPRIVIAPMDVEDCFYQAVQAFNMAEKYQLPVVLLTDQSLSQRTQTIPRPILSQISVVQRSRAIHLNGEALKRYAITEDGVSPVSLPGDPGGRYIATGLEHDEEGNPQYDPEIHEQMMAKRFKKLEKAVEEPRFVAQYGAESGEIGIICWGSTAGVVREAVEEAQAEGLSVGTLIPKMLYPVRSREISQFVSCFRKILVPELNFTGQLATLIRTQVSVDLISYTKCQGVPFTPVEILAKIRELHELGGDSLERQKYAATANS